ncbi:MAG: sulfatase-like hydrolase/transferase [Flavobacteriales bacterium]|nr:sulfatase-like hydrolase/transferase [Flavobacteriia bacterium]NCP05567.1 sulfatase-like hydrolase/transferase [Flavobacteriales bacterium]PIV93511.1 MAG: sulfatase [Flavobacteriaceae bacterium CG17_big_fil_post_rev_8_21_14_2_50_33_15]PIY10566.1 MAG: sulfatase [Flavobacteriaceae bacterium CG_4_10_14_3_um_filter_33_47]PJB17980.1 MAG: sulfatase [Flavobacteriaceae bacterium CG_4_9_14_3_um_filter_33_16]
MWDRLFPKRFSLLKALSLTFLILSFTVRLVFFFWSFSEADNSFFNLIFTFLIGFLFDIGTVSFFTLPYAIYLLIFPKKFHGNLIDKIITYSVYSLGLIIFLFSFFAEITFWEEFKRRFNFIAVDYLIYTNEVVKNINESYPIPLLLAMILMVFLIIFYITKKRNVFKETFHNTSLFKEKLVPTLLISIIVCIFSAYVLNQDSEQFNNRYNNELSKTGIYSFFSAFRNNELSYIKFYKTIDDKQAFETVKNKIKTNNEQFIYPNKNSILRTVINSDSLNAERKPNVIFICIESLSGKFLNALGSDLNITPNLDSLANKGLFFSNLFATGTRTVRGMEAITLSIPPTPGRSIVKRINNQDLFTIGEIFEQQGYERNFFYGGDGYFDNMNTYFGSNGFNIIDRGRGFLLDSSIKTKRTNIEDEEVIFENAWGVCDEDIYNKVIKEADIMHEEGNPFFDFIMTTSNHRPYTYPENRIDIPSGTGREGAVKYTDFAIGDFIKKAKTKPWFENTVFVIMSDHCASSAGKWELDVQNYHIPAIVFNTKYVLPQKIDKLCSQIDLFPTIFGLLHWDYTSNLFGLDILKMQPEDERAFIGNYRKLGLLKGEKLMVLNEQNQSSFYQWNKEDNSLNEIPVDQSFLNETISFYQVADYLYKNNGLKIQ